MINTDMQYSTEYRKLAAEYLAKLTTGPSPSDRKYPDKESIFEAAGYLLGFQPQSLSEAIIVLAHYTFLYNGNFVKDFQSSVGCGLLLDDSNDGGVNSYEHNSSFSYCNWSYMIDHRCGCRGSKGFSVVCLTKDLLTKPFLSGFTIDDFDHDGVLLDARKKHLIQAVEVSDLPTTQHYLPTSTVAAVATANAEADANSIPDRAINFSLVKCHGWVSEGPDYVMYSNGLGGSGQ